MNFFSVSSCLFFYLCFVFTSMLVAVIFMLSVSHCFCFCFCLCMVWFVKAIVKYAYPLCQVVRYPAFYWLSKKIKFKGKISSLERPGFIKKELHVCANLFKYKGPQTNQDMTPMTLKLNGKFNRV